jgi:hypothetical protein
MTSRDLLDAMTRRMEAYDESRDPDLVSSARALAECDALVLLVDNPVDESEEELDAFLEALNAVAWFHWARYVASEDADRPALLAAMALFQMLYQIDPEAVPPELAEQFIGTEMPLQPMTVLWDEMASEIMERAIAQQDWSGADGAVFLLERALAGLPDGHDDRPRYLVNLATACQQRANDGRNPADVRCAIELVDEALAATDHDADVYPTRAALRAGLRKMLFEFTDDVAALIAAVDEYRAVVDLIPDDHVDRVAHLSNLADAGRLLHEVTGDPSVADEGLVVLATLQAELRKKAQPLTTVHRHLMRLIRSRFGDTSLEPADPGPQPRLLDGTLGEVVRRFEATGEPEWLFEPDVDRLLADAPDSPAGIWVRWYRFLLGADVHLDRFTSAPPEQLPAPLRKALDDEYKLGADEISLTARALLWQLERLGDSQLVFRLIDELKAAPANATTEGYLGIAYDIAFHIANDHHLLQDSIAALRSALTTDHQHRARFLEALGGVLMHLDDQNAWREAVALHREAITLPPSAESPLGERWEALGKVLANLSTLTDDPADLAVAIGAFQSAVDATPGDDPKRPARLLLLCSAHAQTGDVSALVALGDRCLAELPDGSAERRDVQAIIGTALLQQDAPDRAIELLRAATTGPTTDPNNETLALLGLAMSEKNLFRQHGELSHLDPALVSYARVLAVPGSDFAHNVVTAQIGRLLHDRFLHSRRRAHLDASILFLRDAADAAEEDEERCGVLDELALALATRFTTAQSRADLDEAIEIRTRLFDASTPVPPRLLADLLLQRHRLTGARSDLDTAIRVLGDDADQDLLASAQAMARDGRTPQTGMRLALEALVADVRAGVVNAAQAERAMPRIRASEHATVRELGNGAAVLLREGNWQEGLLRARLLVAALQDMDDTSTLRAEISLLFVDTARESVALGADPEVFAAARSAGEWALRWAAEHHDERIAGTASFRLGTLHLEPYTRFRHPETMSFQQLTWARRGRAGAIDRTTHQTFVLLGADGEETVITPHGMPSASVALTAAAGHLREAARLRIGEARGEAHRRLTVALVALRQLGEPIDERELTDAVSAALRLLPGNAYAERANLLVHVAPTEALGEARAVADALERNIAGYVDATNADQAVLAAVAAATVLTHTEPDRALALIRRARRVAGRDCAHAYRAQLLHTETTLIPIALAPGWQLPESPLSVPVDTITDCAPDEAVGRLVACAAWAQAQLTRPTPDPRAAKFGLAALNAVPESRRDELLEVTAFLRACIHFGSGTAVDVAGAAWAFWSAGLGEYAVSCIELLPGLIMDIDEDTLLQVLVHLGPVARWMVATEHEDARLLHHVYARMLAAPMGKGMTEVPFSVLISHAKGALLREALMYGPPAVRELGAEERAMLTAIAAAETDLPAHHVPDVKSPLIEESLTVAWADEVQWRSARSEESRLRNRQRAFDQRLAQLMLLHQHLPLPLTFQPLSALQEQLDDSTVLMIHLEMVMLEDGRGAHLQLLLTRQDVRAFVTRQREPYGDVVINGDVTFSLAASGMEVAALRAELQSDPGPAFVAPAALDLLTTGDFALLFDGHAGDTLRAWHAEGRDQLLIAPSGPFHFYPAHLVNVSDTPIADQWKIAYLPNLGLLTRDQNDLPDRTVTLTSIGLDYANHPALPHLAGATAEATACAALFGTEPVFNQSATKERVLAALRSSRYVHIAAHGEHNVDAPAFQVVHLAADESGDGRLFAYELLTEDLTGLALVTLSACETGLGRIDRADNLRGIPAALLLAGVRNIVATMWPIFDQAASCFFSCLYEQLAGGHDVWDAFHTAQHRTRTRFPQYRDWGAFALMGCPHR